MRKYLILIVALCFVFSYGFAETVSTGERVFIGENQETGMKYIIKDSAGIIDDEDLQALEKNMDSVCGFTNAGFLTIPAAYSRVDAKVKAKTFGNEMFGEDSDFIVLIIDLTTRQVGFSLSKSLSLKTIATWKFDDTSDSLFIYAASNKYGEFGIRAFQKCCDEFEDDFFAYESIKEKIIAGELFFDKSIEINDYDEAKVFICGVEASMGNVDAQLMMGDLFYDDAVIHKSYDTAAMYYEMSANAGNAIAQYKLGLMYYDHKYGNDSQMGIDYLQMAAASECADAQLLLGQLVMKGERIQDGYLYVMKLVDVGNADAALWMAKAYEFGNVEGIEKSVENRIKYFVIAAENGSLYAQRSLGLMYYNGIDVDQSDEMAIYYFSMAAEQGDSNSEKMLNSIIEHQ